MSEKWGLPRIPSTAEELLWLIGPGVKPEERPDKLDRLLFARLESIFDFVNKNFPETVIRPQSFDAEQIRLAVLRDSSDPTHYYKIPIAEYDLERQASRAHYSQEVRRYVIYQTAYDQTINRPLTLGILNREFNVITGDIEGDYDDKECNQVLDALDQPNLFIRQHLEESWLAKKMRMRKSRRLGRAAVKFGRLDTIY